MDGQAQAQPELERRLGLSDAVVVGLGAMVGAGVFAAIGPAAAGGATALLLGLLLAAAVAFANATSSAQLAALYPRAGGTYVYGRERLGAWPGYLAGWSFVVGKTASCAAMAMTVGAYAWPALARPVAVAAVLAVTVVNTRGVDRTVTAVRVGLAVVLAALTAVVVAALSAPDLDPGRLLPTEAPSVGAALQAGGLLFFAFAGYARVATMGEEVREPARTIPRAIPLALGLALAVYLAVAVAALAALGAPALAASQAPLADAARAGRLGWLVPAVRVGGVAAAVGVLLSLSAGVGRTTLAMARDRELPAWLAAVDPRHRVPHRAEWALGMVVAAVVLVGDLRGAIGFSSFGVLTYYAIANAAALTLRPDERKWPRALAAAGVAGCAVLALSLPLAAVVGGAIVLATGAALRLARPPARP